MTRMIRVDDDVYEALATRGEELDTFNDKLRRLLSLPDLHVASLQNHGATKRGEQKLIELVEIANRHLPKHWSNSRARMYQILRVVAAYLKGSNAQGPAERQLTAARDVAKDLGIDANTVQDKCGRQLYGTGTGQQLGRFRYALEKIEADYRRKPRNA